MRLSRTAFNTRSWTVMYEIDRIVCYLLPSSEYLLLNIHAVNLVTSATVTQVTVAGRLISVSDLWTK